MGRRPKKKARAALVTESPPVSYRSEWMMVTVLAAIVFVIYANSLDGPFLFDDEANIQNNPHMRMSALTLDGLRKAGFESYSSRRPVANISFALDYYFHRDDVFGYHLVNILIHIATGVILFFFLKTTLVLYKQKSMPPEQDEERSLASFGTCQYIAFCTALIWLVHPIQTQSVSYIVQRMNSMAAMFYLLAFFFYTKARLSETRKRSISLYTACFLAGLLSIGSKENAATLSFFIFLYEWYFFQELSKQWLLNRLAVVAVLLFLLGLLVLVYIGGNPLDTILADYKGRDFTPGQRVLTQFRVIMLYLGLIVLPHPSRLNLEHDIALSYGLFTPLSTLFSILFILAAVGYALYIARSDRLVSFCILWFFGNLVIESSIIPLELIFEHRTYLPSMLLILALVWHAARFMRPKAVKIAGLCLLVAVFSVWTHQRNVVWGMR